MRFRAEAMAAVRAVRGRRVVVVGDVMLDQWVSGLASRLSPEAPVPVVEVHRQSFGLGGAANVASQLAAWGCTVHLVGIIGADADGARLLALCREQGIETSGLVVDDRKTTKKLRVVDRGTQLLRLDWECVDAPGLGIARELEMRASPRADVDAFVVSDYSKGVVSRDSCPRLLTGWSDVGVPTLVDPCAGPWDRYRGAWTLKSNQVEFAAAASHAGLRPDGHDSGRSLRSMLALDRLVMTEGPDGARCWSGDGECRVPAQRTAVADVTGAGDAVLAALVGACFAGFGVEESLGCASLVAGVAVRAPGVVNVTESDLLTTTKDGPMTPDDAATLAAQWRLAGERVVFTNGCFDRLHPGHRHLLREAARFGDRLIVAVNSDASVRRLKGRDRPSEGVGTRAAALAAVHGVDVVVEFDDDSPMRLVQQIRPDVIVKGSDYSPDTIVGARAVKAWGGDVRIVERIDGYSTTAMLRDADSHDEKPS